MLDGTPAPAHAEYIITGEIARQSPPVSGLNSTWISTYGRPQTTHVVACTHIHRQKNPVHWSLAPATIVALASELLLNAHIQNIEGGLDILDIRCLPFAGALVAIVKLKPRVQGQAKTALLGSLSGAAYWVKLAIAVDEDIDASSIRDVLWSIASRTHAEVDIDMIHGLRMLHADPTASPIQAGCEAERIGTRWFIDSTMPALSQPERRATFRRAIPKNFEAVDLSRYRFS
jgi:4-hydroxy-3-polyprenylbenzoate decarboxylase